MNGATFAAGEVGQAFFLNGTTQYVNVAVASGSSLDPTGPVTVEGWIFRDATGVQHSIVEKYGASSGGYALRVSSANKLQFITLDNSQTGDVVTGATSLLAGVWYHVAGLWDGSTLQVYVNGILDGAANSMRNPKAGGTPVRLGARGDDVGTPFAGLIDEVAIYNRGLSAAEVASIYNAGPLGKAFSSLLLRASVQGGLLLLSFPATPGKAYTIQSANELSTGVWGSLTNIIAADTNVVYFDSISTLHRFYRVATHN
jgi:hypothetical protein